MKSEMFEKSASSTTSAETDIEDAKETRVFADCKGRDLVIGAGHDSQWVIVKLEGTKKPDHEMMDKKAIGAFFVAEEKEERYDLTNVIEFFGGITRVKDDVREDIEAWLDNIDTPDPDKGPDYCDTCGSNCGPVCHNI